MQELVETSRRLARKDIGFGSLEAISDRLIKVGVVDELICGWAGFRCETIRENVNACAIEPSVSMSERAKRVFQQNQSDAAEEPPKINPPAYARVAWQ